tara:strand:+ start:545 stop:742 length:198 start_codon:yes stop_codon:yes gene_type:complete
MILSAASWPLFESTLRIRSIKYEIDPLADFKYACTVKKSTGKKPKSEKRKKRKKRRRKKKKKHSV